MNIATENVKSIIQPQPMRSRTPMLMASALPTLPGYVFKLNQLLAAAKADVNSICQVIRTDAGLTAQVLRLANVYRLVSHPPICTVSEAVDAVGIQRLKMMVITCPLLDCAGDIKQLSNLQSFWQHNFMTAELSEAIAKAISYAWPEVAYTAGMLRDIGELSLIVQSVQDGTSWPPQEDHQKTGKLRSREAGRRLAIACRFTPAMVEVCACADPSLAWRDPLLVSIVQCASRFCEAAGLASGEEPRQLLAGAKLKTIAASLRGLPGLTPLQCSKLANQLIARFRELIPALEFNVSGLLRAASIVPPPAIEAESFVEMAIA